MNEGTPLLSSVDARIEAVIFASSKPVRIRDIAPLMPDGVDVKASLDRICEFWKGRGVEIVRINDAWTPRPREDLLPETADPRSRRLSSAAVATLAVIAMHQPITWQQIEKVRGVKLARGIIDGLKSADLITEIGRRRGSGQAISYGVTQTFLERFNLSQLTDMPTPEEAFMLDLDVGN